MIEVNIKLTKSDWKNVLFLLRHGYDEIGGPSDEETVRLFEAQVEEQVK